VPARGNTNRAQGVLAVKGFVAAGHVLTCKAAAQTLQKGGNAFDAAVAAGFAAAVTEPTLSSPGGGGFLLAHVQRTGQDIVFDFFVNTPGKSLSQKIEPHFFPVTVDFKDSAQDFHIGMGSVAVPSALKGFPSCPQSTWPSSSSPGT